MTQEPDAQVDTPAAGLAMAAGTVGAMLRQLREAKGWSLDEVSSRLKFSVRQIDALESERWSELPQGVSLRGLVRNYARLLEADGQAVATALGPQLGAGTPLGLGQSHHVLGPSTEPERAYGSLLWLAVILAVLIAGIGYAFWQGWLPGHWLSFDWLSRFRQ